jgi:uracil-DNA glycosylase
LKPLLIGQAPGPETDPWLPLSGRSGARLARLCRIDLDEFLAAFDRVNLIGRFPGKAGKGDGFPLQIARRRALALSRGFGGRTVVLLGGNVSAAFCVAPAPLLRWRRGALGAARLAIAPHPSGISRWWNEPENVRAATRFFRRLARESTPGL